MHQLSTEQKQQISELTHSGRVISAIKLYRDFTGAGLKGAKEAVEAMTHGTPANIPRNMYSDTQNVALLEDQIKQLLSKRQKIKAVRLYREARHCGLKEAKDAVDAIETQMKAYSSASLSNDPFAEDVQRNRSCLVLVLTILLLGAGALVVFNFFGNGF
jgi:ribosomal protein L7/L12